jgi:peroxiredoxin
MSFTPDTIVGRAQQETTMPFITASTDGTPIHYVDQGSGRPVVLVHGWPLSHRMWEAQIAALVDAGYRTVAYDRRGFGDSGKAAGGYDYDVFAADLDDLVTALDLHDATLVGFSMGGGEVARYIGTYGTARLSQAALLGAVPPFLLQTADNPDGAPPALFDGMIAGLKADRIGFLDQFFPNFYNSDTGADRIGADLIAFSKWIAWAASPLATQQCVTAFGTTDFRADLRKFDVPTLIVHGDADRIVPIEGSALKSHAAIAGSRLEVLKGAPHGFAATHASELNALLLSFLRG